VQGLIQVINGLLANLFQVQWLHRLHVLFVPDGKHQVQILEHIVGLHHALAQVGQGRRKHFAVFIHFGEHRGQPQGVGQGSPQVVRNHVSKLLQITVVAVQVLGHGGLASFYLLAEGDVLLNGHEFG